MTTAEKTELALILPLGGSLWLLTPMLPDTVGVGTLLLEASGLVLFQGLLRDLWLLAREKRAPRTGPRREAHCLCMESSVGVTGVVLGLAVLGTRIDHSIPASPWFWSGWATAAMALGFVMKDFVWESSPFRVRRDKDHLNIVVAWKR